MRNNWMILLLLCWITTVDSLRIYPECQPKPKWVQEWRGSEILIKAWFNMDSKTEFKVEMRIKGTLSKLKKYENEDIITVGQKFVKIKKRRDGKSMENETHFEEPLGSGWQQFEFEATSSKVNLRHKSKNILSWEVTNIIEELEVISSNVTLNCEHNEFWWPVGTGETPTIPLTADNGEKEISFYSNREFQPTLTLSNSRDSVTLGWDGENKTINKDNQGFLPANVKHTLYISCDHNHNKDVECAIKGKVKIITFYVREMPKALHVSSENGEEFIVLQLSPFQEQTSAMTAISNVHQERTSTVKTLVSASEVTYHKTTVNGLPITGLSILNLIVSICLAISGITLYLIWKKGKVHESDVSRRDVESGDENERQQIFQLCGLVVKGDTTMNGIKMDPSVKEKQDFGLNETRDGGCSMDKISIENKRTNSEVHKSHVSRRDVESGEEKEWQLLNETSEETDMQQTLNEINEDVTEMSRAHYLQLRRKSIQEIQESLQEFLNEDNCDNN